ncbi:MAG: hypothetical protein IJQ29_05915 [Synergistaceae bacterium]|nr:hypothetical protein [Synergistaceae bacterium]
MRIFAPNYDKLKLWGALVLFVAYLIALPQLHFVPASIIFIFLFCLITCCLTLIKPSRLILV